MRADEFIKEEEKLDEVLPLITGAAALAGGIAKGAGAVASGVGKGIGAAAKGTGKAVGAIGNKVASSVTGNQENPEVDQAKDKLIKPGVKLPLATKATGGPEQFKITRVQGDDVEIENPKPQANEPNKVVYKRDDLKKSMSL